MIKVIERMILNIKFGKNIYYGLEHGIKDINYSIIELRYFKGKKLKVNSYINPKYYIDYNGFTIPEPVNVNNLEDGLFSYDDIWEDVYYIPYPTNVGFIEITLNDLFDRYDYIDMLAYKDKDIAKRVSREIYDETDLSEKEELLIKLLEHIKCNMIVGNEPDDGIYLWGNKLHSIDVRSSDLENIHYVKGYSKWKGFVVPKVATRFEDCKVWFVPHNNINGYLKINEHLTIRSELLYTNPRDAIKASKIIF